MQLYLVFCLHYLYVSESALFLPSTAVLFFSMDVVLTLSSVSRGILDDT